MKRIKTITALMCMLMTISACGREKNHFGDTYDRDTTVSFDQLKDIAYDDSETEKNYTLKSYIPDSASSDFMSVSCAGSEMYVCYDNTLGDYYLRRVNHEKDVSYKVGTGVVSAGYPISSISAIPVLYLQGYPIIIFGQNSNSGYDQVIYIDCFGNILKKVNVDTLKEINYDETFTRGETTYVSIRQDLSFYSYFKYSLKNKSYSVSNVEKTEFDNARSNLSNSLKDLVPVYDKEGEIFSYVIQNSDIVYVYDKDKKYLNSVYINAFGFKDPVSFRFEKKLCFFESEIYYENQNEKSSKESYKCKCLEINLENGKVSYDDDFKYFINSAKDVEYEDKYQYTYIIYNELNDKREKDGVTLCSIAKENLSFNNSFVYDGFRGSVYKIDKDAVLCNFSGDYYLCTKDERKIMNNLSVKNILKNEIIFNDSNGNYYICERSNFVDYIENPTDAYKMISTNSYFGEHIKVKEDPQTKALKVVGKGTNLEVDSSNLTLVNNYGLIVNTKGVYFSNGNVVCTFKSSTVEKVSLIFTLRNWTLFRIGENAPYSYFFLETTEK